MTYIITARPLYLVDHDIAYAQATTRYEMDDDIELADGYCPKCGEPLYTRLCTAPHCDDGYVDMHEADDPLWYDPGDYEVCDECQGHGRFIWCRNCGYDALEKEETPAG